MGRGDALSCAFAMGIASLYYLCCFLVLFLFFSSLILHMRAGSFFPPLDTARKEYDYVCVRLLLFRLFTEFEHALPYGHKTFFLVI
jgi:hypothetical protein